MKRGENSLEGDAEVEWGPSEFSPLQSKFNCSGLDGNNLEFHLQLFQPKSRNPSQVIGSIDGTFDRISGRHRAR